MPLYQMLYLSRTNQSWSTAELEALCVYARARNTQDGLTGLLLYGNGHFVQLLEGRRQPLLLTYNRICLDPRHGDIVLLVDGPISQRSFPEWAMGALNVDSSGDIDRQRFRDIVAAFAKSAGPVPEHAVALTLLKEFRTHASARPSARLPDLAD
ncbi:BLUF domain-containing protein [Luteitalea sp.]